MPKMLREHRLTEVQWDSSLASSLYRKNDEVTLVRLLSVDMILKHAKDVPFNIIIIIII